MGTPVDNYLMYGCGRCPLGYTPACKVHRWHQELVLLRQIVLSCGLTEELKWGVPCYTFAGRNEVVVAALKNCASINFFNGVLLDDPHRLLVKPGKNSLTSRVIRLSSEEQIYQHEAAIKTLLEQVKYNAQVGAKPVIERQTVPIPVELQEAFAQDPAFQVAFEALTPGRQRGYLMYFAQPKQAPTRLSRIERYKTHIFNGKGLNDY